MFRVMIVDDEEMIRHGIKTYLMRGGYNFDEIYTASNGHEALSLLDTRPLPHLLITDICMPQMSGIELLQIIRNRRIPCRVIVLSGYNDFEYVRSAAILGIENYLLKPVNDDELHQTLHNTLAKLQREEKLLSVQQMNADLIRENIINRWIYGAISETELVDRAEFLELDLECTYFQPCILRLLGTDENKNIDLKQQIYDICSSFLSTVSCCYFSRNYNGDTIAVFCQEEEDLSSQTVARALNNCIHEISRRLSVKPYVLLGRAVEGYWNVASSFSEALGNGIFLGEIPLVDPATGSNEDPSNISSPFSYLLAEYVLEHYREDLNLKMLAAHFKGNAAYIGQIFKRDIGRPFTEYLKHVRLEKAKELLINSYCSAKEIAEKVGFQNASYFCTVFKKETGLTPAEYRKNFGS